MKRAKFLGIGIVLAALAGVVLLNAWAEEKPADQLRAGRHAGIVCSDRGQNGGGQARDRAAAGRAVARALRP